MTTLILDPSALVHRYAAGPHQNLVADAMESATTWCATELARTEVMLALHQVAGQPLLARELWAVARDDYLAALTAAGLVDVHIVSEADASELLAGDCCSAGVTAADLKGVVTSAHIAGRKPAHNGDSQ